MGTKPFQDRCQCVGVCFYRHGVGVRFCRGLSVRALSPHIGQTGRLERAPKRRSRKFLICVKKRTLRGGYIFETALGIRECSRIRAMPNPTRLFGRIAEIYYLRIMNGLELYLEFRLKAAPNERGFSGVITPLNPAFDSGFGGKENLLKRRTSVKGALSPQPLSANGRIRRGSSSTARRS